MLLHMRYQWPSILLLAFLSFHASTSWGWSWNWSFTSAWRSANDKTEVPLIEAHRDHDEYSPYAESNLRIRHEWGDLTKGQRLEYITATQCMMSRPTHLDRSVYPGVETRWDDFVATHLNYTETIHVSAFFLPWHRNFLWLFENALRDECGYNGTIPYWDWTKSAQDLEKSPMFDGSETSFGGNGPFDPKAQPDKKWEHLIGNGTGGGCVLSGPFVNHTVRLGPILEALDGHIPRRPDAFFAHPRCLHRNFRQQLNRLQTNETCVSLALGSSTMEEFQSWLDAPPIPGLGMHLAGHATVGGEMDSAWVSTNEPTFWLHHAQIDRLWLRWQSMVVSPERLKEISGTRWSWRIGRPGRLDDGEGFGIEDRWKTIEEMMDPCNGGFCYDYADAGTAMKVE